jgi:hypothetical protein
VTTVDPLLEEKSFYSDIIFKDLTGLTRSEDASLNYYGMQLNNQNTTEDGFKRFSTIAADIIIEKIFALKRKGKSPSDTELEDIMRKSLSEAWKKYNEESN